MDRHVALEANLNVYRNDNAELLPIGSTYGKTASLKRNKAKEVMYPGSRHPLPLLQPSYPCHKRYSTGRAKQLLDDKSLSRIPQTSNDIDNYKSSSNGNIPDIRNNHLLMTEFGNSRIESSLGTKVESSNLPASCYVYGQPTPEQLQVKPILRTNRMGDYNLLERGVVGDIQQILPKHLNLNNGDNMNNSNNTFTHGQTRREMRNKNISGIDNESTSTYCNQKERIKDYKMKPWKFDGKLLTNKQYDEKNSKLPVSLLHFGKLSESDYTGSIGQKSKQNCSNQRVYDPTGDFKKPYASNSKKSKMNMTTRATGSPSSHTQQWKLKEGLRNNSDDNRVKVNNRINIPKNLLASEELSDENNNDVKAKLLLPNSYRDPNIDLIPNSRRHKEQNCLESQYGADGRQNINNYVHENNIPSSPKAPYTQIHQNKNVNREKDRTYKSRQNQRYDDPSINTRRVLDQRQVTDGRGRRVRIDYATVSSEKLASRISSNSEEYKQSQNRVLTSPNRSAGALKLLPNTTSGSAVNHSARKLPPSTMDNHRSAPNLTRPPTLPPLPRYDEIEATRYLQTCQRKLQQDLADNQSGQVRRNQFQKLDQLPVRMNNAYQRGDDYRTSVRFDKALTKDKGESRYMQSSNSINLKQREHKPITYAYNVRRQQSPIMHAKHVQFALPNSMDPRKQHTGDGPSNTYDAVRKEKVIIEKDEAKTPPHQTQKYSKQLKEAKPTLLTVPRPIQSDTVPEMSKSKATKIADKKRCDIRHLDSMDTDTLLDKLAEKFDISELRTYIDNKNKKESSQAKYVTTNVTDQVKDGNDIKTSSPEETESLGKTRCKGTGLKKEKEYVKNKYELKMRKETKKVNAKKMNSKLEKVSYNSDANLSRHSISNCIDGKQNIPSNTNSERNSDYKSCLSKCESLCNRSECNQMESEHSYTSAWNEDITSEESEKEDRHIVNSKNYKQSHRLPDPMYPYKRDKDTTTSPKRNHQRFRQDCPELKMDTHRQLHGKPSSYGRAYSRNRRRDESPYSKHNDNTDNESYIRERDNSIRFHRTIHTKQSDQDHYLSKSVQRGRENCDYLNEKRGIRTGRDHLSTSEIRNLRRGHKEKRERSVYYKTMDDKNVHHTKGYSNTNWDNRNNRNDTDHNCSDDSEPLDEYIRRYQKKLNISPGDNIPCNHRVPSSQEAEPYQQVRGAEARFHEEHRANMVYHQKRRNGEISSANLPSDDYPLDEDVCLARLLDGVGRVHGKQNGGCGGEGREGGGEFKVRPTQPRCCEIVQDELDEKKRKEKDSILHRYKVDDDDLEVLTRLNRYGTNKEIEKTYVNEKVANAVITDMDVAMFMNPGAGRIHKYHQPNVEAGYMEVPELKSNSRPLKVNLESGFTMLP